MLYGYPYYRNVSIIAISLCDGPSVNGSSVLSFQLFERRMGYSVKSWPGACKTLLDEALKPSCGGNAAVTPALQMIEMRCSPCVRAFGDYPAVSILFVSAEILIHRVP